MRNVLTIVHPEGWRFIGIFGVVASILYLLGNQIGHFWGDIGFILTAWCVYFFRNPERVTPTRPGLIVSPADGKIVAIKEVTPPKELMLEGGPRTRISIFLNVFDVHVNRIPIEGTIIQSLYHPGKFFNASLDKASEHNERQTLGIEMDDKKDLAVVQIAGLIARRIRCDVGEDEKVSSGQRYGIIRFGSRADVYLPIGVNALVVEGQRTVGGETVLADLESVEDNRQGAIN